MLRQVPRPRIARLLETQFALADALHGLTPVATRAAVVPTPPPGMRWLITPREALDVTPSGDASMMRQAFARYLFWRLFLGQRRPTKESLRECARRLRGLALYRAALKLHAAGRPLPLKASVSARDIPAYALTPPEQLHRLSTRAAGDKQLSQQMSQAELDMLLAARWWDSFGDDAEMVASDLFDVQRLLTDEDYAVAGEGLMLSDLFGMLADEGLSDLDIAGLLDGAWNGQAVLWAGNQVFDEAGIAASFAMSDPWFYDFLRNQSGYLISNIDRWSRRDIADDLWQWMGGEGGPGLSWEKIARLLERDYGPYELSNLQGYSADYRAYMIALTETARAEGFGMFVSLWESGAQRKIWIVQAGACIRCIANAEAGDIPITQSFPSGVQFPPAHPVCRCGGASALSETFSPGDWVPRDPQDLAPYLSNWTGGLWPNVDLSDLDELSGIGPNNWQQADLFPRSQRARAAKTRQRPATPTPLAAHLSTERYKTLGQTLATLAGQVAQQWATTAHVGVPTTENDLKRIMRRLRSHDELPDAREADEQYIHTFREGLREVLRHEPAS